ncbi:MAG: FtsX-like permease family protein [Hyphomonas sp.]
MTGALLLPLLALRDLVHGWRAGLCLVFAVCVALLPVLFLGGLGQGVVNTLIDRLRSDPRILELRLARDLELSPDWFAALEEDVRVGFMLPRARHLAASVRMRGPDASAMQEPRLVPTAAGDPLLAGLPVPMGLDQMVLTERLSIASGAGVGNRVSLIVLRQVGERRESVQLDVMVVGVLPRNMLQSDDIFVDRALETAIERWREGYSVPELSWPGADGQQLSDAPNRSFASFRMYARDIRDVPGLRDTLLQQGLDVSTRAEEIEMALAIESGLAWVFSVVTVFSVLGFVLTLGLHLAASVIEKAREYAVLRLLGFRAWLVAIIPSLQGGLIAGGGAGLAALAAWNLQPVVNQRLQGLAGLDGPIMALRPVHLAVAVALSVLAGLVAGCVAGWRAGRLQIAEGLRRD